MSSLPVDRFVEIGLEWFHPTDPGPQAEVLHTRLAPLWSSAGGRHGLVINAGWVVDIITEWSGDPAQPLPFRSRRLAHWHDATYADLQALIAALRARAPRPDVAIGIMVVGWGNFVWPPDTRIYDFDSHWYDRHPELYPHARSMVGMPDLDPRVPLLADDHRYAAFPDGIEAGTLFPAFLGAQWGELAGSLDLDVIHLRDACFGPMVYSRIGPTGTSAPDDLEEIRSWTTAVSSLFRAVKDAAPDALVFGYSSAISAVAERRVGLVDLEQVVADGGIDVWIDQSWGGAWQDWWDHHWKGWTFQVANLLVHAAILAAGNRRRRPDAAPCVHYNLIETWDSWEPWDTLHRTPGKLRWGIWALSHAALLTDDGPQVVGGSYISWANYRDGRLMSEQDVAFVAGHLDAAQRSATALEAVHGPTAVFDGDALELLEQRSASGNHSEWLDDQVAMLMKFALPVLSVAAPGTVDDRVDGTVHAAPRRVADTDAPTLVAARADVLPDGFAARVGIVADGPRRAADFVDGHAVGHPDLPDAEVVHLPEHQPVTADAADELAYDSAAGPLVVRAGATTWWQPPDWSAPPQPLLPRSQLGTAAVHAVAARTLARQVAAAGGNHADPVALHEPVTWHLWRSAGTVHVLVGNLESGWLGDARHPRRVRIVLDAEGLGLDPDTAYQLSPATPDDGDPVPGAGLAFVVDVPPEGCRMLHLAEVPA
ncbi:MAG: hypothetical protein JJT89_02755 [Nitriliruptoraceae bacterium]|nr:hypothetical protein [Nitriliruptoraceae bacterium]